MGERTEVDPDALRQAAAAAVRLSGEVRAASGAGGSALARTASAMAGARAQSGVTAVRFAATGLLDELGRVLDELSAVLGTAARDYAEADRAAAAGAPRAAATAPRKGGPR